MAYAPIRPASRHIQRGRNEQSRLMLS